MCVCGGGGGGEFGLCINCINYWFLFYTTQKVLMPVQNLHLSLHVWSYLKNKQEIDVIVLAKGFTEDLGDAIIILALMEF